MPGVNELTHFLEQRVLGDRVGGDLNRRMLRGARHRGARGDEYTHLPLRRGSVLDQPTA